MPKLADRPLYSGLLGAAAYEEPEPDPAEMAARVLRRRAEMEGGNAPDPAVFAARQTDDEEIVKAATYLADVGRLPSWTEVRTPAPVAEAIGRLNKAVEVGEVALRKIYELDRARLDAARKAEAEAVEAIEAGERPKPFKLDPKLIEDREAAVVELRAALKVVGRRRTAVDAAIRDALPAWLIELREVFREHVEGMREHVGRLLDHFESWKRAAFDVINADAHAATMPGTRDRSLRPGASGFVSRVNAVSYGDVAYIGHWLRELERALNNPQSTDWLRWIDAIPLVPGDVVDDGNASNADSGTDNSTDNSTDNGSDSSASGARRRSRG
ncbi:hypothetical protein TH66_13045 [Carbonactinospora thermoautotrophica]|uniref:Uncharacterized protein n=1 Tax=Carbonactinospora thermoautotrophica TaxID=1469144 RepID=A0A132NDF2_9ACTN|nr:hypothetical protein [Carbonactinospora thermoautotrophica]KWX03719.1 hypothetical protein TH66_13045 [Carbonactinospora thermoautotrophica]KWX08179.1 hypothetical protein TR74_16120 [Carbonactinospora thermoautotrophica]